MADENRKDDATNTLTDDDIVASPTATRRSALRMIGTIVLGSVVGAAIVARPGAAEAASDSDPNDAAGHGRTGRTDSDPNDRGGRGRGSGTGRSDSDPNDAGGHGRTGRTDNDPNDGAGRGRGGGG